MMQKDTARHTHGARRFADAAHSLWLDAGATDLLFSETEGAALTGAQALLTDTPPNSVTTMRDFWLGTSVGGSHTLTYSLRNPQGATCLTTNLAIEAIVAKFATNTYFAVYGANTGIDVALSDVSYDPAGYTLRLNGTLCATGQPPWQVAVSNLSAGAHTLTVQSRTFPDLVDEATLYIIKVSLVPDYDRDGVIGTLDKARAATNEVFRFWINDDDDNGVVGGNDIPGDGTADASNGSVDGIRDLIDFFPVWADLGDALIAFPANEYSYKVSHASGALNAFACPLQPASENPNLRPDAYLYSTNAAASYGGSAVAQVTASGLVLAADYLAEVAASGR